jgi:hypothetical protein
MDAESIWSEEDTTPGAIEAALRALLLEAYAREDAYVPARVLNLVCVVDREWRGEILNRLEGVGRYHPSRTILCAVEPGRTTIDASVAMTTEEGPGGGGEADLPLIRERILLDLGPRHLEALNTIVDPLVISDIATVTWSPHGHPEAVDALLHLSQVVLVDSVNEPDAATAVARARELAREAYVVDLAWLRSTPWRERIAATFDPPAWRASLREISGISITAREDSVVAGVLLLGWLSCRLGWQPSELIKQQDVYMGTAHSRRHDIKIKLYAQSDLPVPGLSGVQLETASGTKLSLDRGPGGLQAKRVARDGRESSWVVLGASRGEAGILGEGIRQALLRDPTYRPALECAHTYLGTA